jgi:nicotinamidase-related amidase
MLKDFKDKAASSAILVVDMTVDGLHGFESPRETEEMCSNLQNFIEATGIRPIYCNTIWSVMGSPSKSSLKMLPCWGNALPTSMEVHKKLQSAFQYDICGGIVIPTDLHGFLQKNGIRDLFITGVEAPLCVLDTALDGAQKGYSVNLVQDLCWTSPSVCRSSRFVEIAEKVSGIEGIQLVNSSEFLPRPPLEQHRYVAPTYSEQKLV